MALPISEKFNYTELKSETASSGVRHYTAPDGIKLPSVTTILSATKDMTGLDAWRERIGDEQADKEIREAVNIGNLLHQYLEYYLLDVEHKPGSNMIHRMAKQMADNVINRGLNRVDEVWGVEVPLYFPHAYAGRSDLIGVFEGVPSIMDFKNAKKIKKLEWIEDYMMQGVAYSLAHNELYETNIRQIVIFMASRDMKFETFIINGREYDDYCDKWIARLGQYLEMQEEKKL